MLEPTRLAGPNRHVFKIRWVAASRQVPWIVLQGAGYEFLGERLRQYGTQHPARRLIRDSQEKPIIGEHLQHPIVFRVITNVEFQRDVLRRAWDANNRAEEPFPSASRSAGWAIV